MAAGTCPSRLRRECGLVMKGIRTRCMMTTPRIPHEQCASEFCGVMAGVAQRMISDGAPGAHAALATPRPRLSIRRPTHPSPAPLHRSAAAHFAPARLGAGKAAASVAVTTSCRLRVPSHRLAGAVSRAAKPTRVRAGAAVPLSCVMHSRRGWIRHPLRPFSSRRVSQAGAWPLRERLSLPRAGAWGSGCRCDGGFERCKG